MSSQDEADDPVLNGGGSDIDEDGDIVANARRTTTTTNGAANDTLGDDDEADLFGSAADDDDDDHDNLDRPGLLDDEDLDSGDDQGRRNRDEADEEQDQAMEDVALSTLTANVGRHQVPQPSDGELYLLKVPQFLSIDPKPFEAENFVPPVADHHLDEPSDAFNAHSTAMTTIRWRTAPSDPSRVQSNARVLRWSDGSLTLQLATEPSNQYSLSGKALAPPQLNPVKPTPVSLKRDRKGNQLSGSYDPGKDSFTYLAAPSTSDELFRITNKVTVGLSVQPTEDVAVDAVARLQAAMKQAALEKGGAVQTHVTEDPELAKKRAELAEKEIARVERKRQNAATRGEGRNDRSLGRRGGGGLTVGGLEDDEDELGQGYQGGRTAAAARKPKQRRQNRRGEIYSDDEEEGDIRGRTREDEYDEEDDFVAGSDEEEEVGDDDDDLDEGISLDHVKRRQDGASKRESPQVEGDVDAEGDPESDVGPGAGGDGSPVSRSKRRRVIDDDDDEDE